MPYDKVIDSAKLETAITATADAIRAKTGSTDKIPWDADTGMSGAVESIATGIEPTGTLNITDNGTYDVTEYASAEVAVPDSGTSGPFCVVSVTEGERKGVGPVVNIAAAVSVETPSGVEYYYNHEQLPEIPADVVENYPYLTIMRNASTSVIRMAASTAKGYVHTTEEGEHRFTIPTTESVWRMDADLTAGGWVLVGQSTSSWFGTNGSGSWTPWWANYDIPNGSPDATEVYLPAMEAETEAPAEPTHFYYGGMRFPKLPSDFDGLPYLLIKKNPNASTYQLMGCATKMWRNPSKDANTTNAIDQNAGSLTYCNIAPGDESWGVVSSGNYYSTYDFIVWSNFNIPEGTQNATTIHYYGTLAVPATE